MLVFSLASLLSVGIELLEVIGIFWLFIYLYFSGLTLPYIGFLTCCIDCLKGLNGSEDYYYNADEKLLFGDLSCT